MNYLDQIIFHFRFLIQTQIHFKQQYGSSKIKNMPI